MPSVPNVQLPPLDAPAKRRPPPRYSLLSLLELAAIVALGLASWRSWGSLLVVVNLLILAAVLAFVVGRRRPKSSDQRVAIGCLAFWVTLVLGAVVTIAVFL